VSCATEQPVLPNWELAERDQEVVVEDPLSLPELCAIPLDGIWPVECWLKLDAYDIVAIANTRLAGLNASALRKSDASYDALVEAGKLQQQLAIIRQDLLEQSRQAHKADRWYYRTIIALGLAVGASL
jgi:hypothetical protein